MGEEDGRDERDEREERGEEGKGEKVGEPDGRVEGARMESTVSTSGNTSSGSEECVCEENEQKEK